jgi:hypothetical protein
MKSCYESDILVNKTRLFHVTPLNLLISYIHFLCLLTTYGEADST